MLKSTGSQVVRHYVHWPKKPCSPVMLQVSITNVCKSWKASELPHSDGKLPVIPSGSVLPHSISKEIRAAKDPLPPHDHGNVPVTQLFVGPAWCLA